jgi:hypothetical protein
LLRINASKLAVGIPFAIAVTVCLYLFVPRYELRSVGGSGVFIRVDRWRGDMVSSYQMGIEPRDSRGRRVLDGGTQFASPGMRTAVANVLNQERLRAARLQHIALGVIGCGVAASITVLIFTRKKPASSAR